MTRRRILNAARQLLIAGTYSQVTMAEVASEAGVAYQTVYSAFGTKLRLAQAIIEEGWPHVDEAMKLVDEGRRSTDPQIWLRTAARVSRLIYEPCAELHRFMRESGDPNLLARYRQNAEQRYIQFGELGTMLERSGRLRAGISGQEAQAILWAMTSPDCYAQLVFERRWSPMRYEAWLGEGLINMLLRSVDAATPRSPR